MFILLSASLCDLPTPYPSLPFRYIIIVILASEVLFCYLPQWTLNPHLLNWLFISPSLPSFVANGCPFHTFLPRLMSVALWFSNCSISWFASLSLLPLPAACFFQLFLSAAPFQCQLCPRTICHYGALIYVSETDSSAADIFPIISSVQRENLLICVLQSWRDDNLMKDLMCAWKSCNL